MVANKVEFTLPDKSHYSTEVRARIRLIDGDEVFNEAGNLTGIYPGMVYQCVVSAGMKRARLVFEFALDLLKHSDYFRQNNGQVTEDFNLINKRFRGFVRSMCQSNSPLHLHWASKDFYIKHPELIGQRVAF